MTIYLLMVLYFQAPSLMVEGAYTSYVRCDAVARARYSETVKPVCQSIKVKDDKK